MHGNAHGCGHARSQICRDRIKHELQKTEDGRARLQAFDERKKRSEDKGEVGSQRMEARAAEEILRERLPEGVRVQGGEDGGTRTPLAGESGDEAMDEEEKDAETGEMDEMADDSEPVAAGGEQAAADMGLPEGKTAEDQESHRLDSHNFCSKNGPPQFRGAPQNCGGNSETKKDIKRG